MIKIIDANTGEQLTPGKIFENITGTVEVLEISNNLFNPWAIVEINGIRRIVKESLKYRFFHPDFMFQPMFFWCT